MAIMHAPHLASVDLNLLVVLDALLAEKHVTRAARRIGLSQSAMSHALARLRELLGDPILVRSPAGMVPSARAAALREPLRRMLSEVEGLLLERPTFDPSTAARTFTIASSDYFTFALFPALAAQLHQEAPQVDLVARAADDPTAGLEEGAADLALVPLHAVEPRTGLRTRPVLRERFVCVVRAGHPLGKRRLTLERFVAMDHLLVAPRGRSGGIVDTELEKHGLRRRVAVTVPQFLVAPHIVASTDLVVTLTERVARRFADWLPLRLLPPPIEIPGFVTAAIWHARNDHDPAHMWLRKTVEACARRL